MIEGRVKEFTVIRADPTESESCDFYMLRVRAVIFTCCDLCENKISIGDDADRLFHLYTIIEKVATKTDTCAR